MSKQAQFSNGPMTLDASDLEKVAGGYDEVELCPRFPRFPFPPRPTLDLGQLLTIPVSMA